MTVLKGFSDPILDTQVTFRLILHAMSRPGTIVALPRPQELPEGLGAAAAAVLLTLTDQETPLWIEPERAGVLAGWLAFQTGSPAVAGPEDATFALLPGMAAEPALSAFPAGEDRYPDRSTTIVVECEALRGGSRTVRIAGPGIETPLDIAPSGLHGGFWSACIANHARFPLGVDLVLVAGTEAMALARTTSISVSGGA